MPEESSEPRPWLRWFNVAGVTIGFVLLVLALVEVASLAVPEDVDWSARAQVMFQISTVGAAELLAVGALWGVLRRQDRSFSGLGLWQPASRLGWILALLLAAATVGINLLGALRGQLSVITEMSGFYLYSATVAGVSAGFCEEILFRGFVMDEIEKAGSGKLLQVLGSAVTFGLAHAGLVLQVALMEGGGWITATANLVMFTVLGAAYAGIYMASRRSLMPVIVSHLLNDFFVIPLAFLAALQASS